MDDPSTHPFNLGIVSRKKLNSRKKNTILPILNFNKLYNSTHKNTLKKSTNTISNYLSLLYLLAISQTQSICFYFPFFILNFHVVPK